MPMKSLGSIAGASCCSRLGILAIVAAGFLCGALSVGSFLKFLVGLR